MRKATSIILAGLLIAVSTSSSFSANRAGKSPDPTRLCNMDLNTCIAVRVNNGADQAKAKRGCTTQLQACAKH
jgi:hypothetical protein